MEIYTYVCERLAEDSCRRIRQFRGVGRTGRCKFTTWLAAVTFNLAREWIRTSKGRRRMFRAVQRLPRLERLVFRYYFWEGYSPVEIARTLSISRGMPVGAADVANSLSAIYRVLSRDHRWRVITRLLRESPDVSIDAKLDAVGEGTGTLMASHREHPEQVIDRDRGRRLLAELLGKLPRDQRISIELKFQRGMSARAIASALGIDNYKRVYELQARGLRQLADRLEQEGIDLGTFLDERSGKRAER
jgi:RNA polymerase sigma factor (sigma-70 family)